MKHAAMHLRYRMSLTLPMVSQSSFENRSSISQVK